MPKKAVKIPAASKSDGVRWTLQVSADASAKRARTSAARAPKSTAKRAAAKSPAKRRKSPGVRKPAADSPVAARRHASTTTAPATTAAALSTSAVSLTAGRRIAAIAAASVLMLAAIAIMRDPARGISATVNARPPSADALELTPQSITATELEAPRISRQGSTTKPSATVPADRRQPLATEARPGLSALSSKPPASPVTLAPTPPPATPHATESITRAAVPDAPTTVLAANTTASTESRNASAVTITGCLEGTTDGDRFRLTDTEGTDAPKSRGWRSGFLKKRAAAVELINVRDSSSLRRLVGHRVVTTGLLDSRELSVRSVAPAGQRCD